MENLGVSTPPPSPVSSWDRAKRRPGRLSQGQSRQRPALQGNVRQPNSRDSAGLQVCHIYQCQRLGAFWFSPCLLFSYLSPPPRVGKGGLFLSCVQTSIPASIARSLCSPAVTPWWQAQPGLWAQFLSPPAWKHSVWPTKKLKLWWDWQPASSLRLRWLTWWWKHLTTTSQSTWLHLSISCFERLAETLHPYILPDWHKYQKWKRGLYFC